MAAISRRAARECAVKTLYSYDFHLEMPAEDFFAATCEECELPYNDFARELFLGAVSHKASIDEKISAYAKGWSLDRIAHISLAILRLCTYELLFTEVPTPVAINEAVELAKLYDGDDAPARHGLQALNGGIHGLIPPPAGSDGRACGPPARARGRRTRPWA